MLPTKDRQSHLAGVESGFNLSIIEAQLHASKPVDYETPAFFSNACELVSSRREV